MQRTRSLTRTHGAVALAALVVAVTLAARPAGAGWPTVATNQSSNLIHDDTRFSKLDPVFQLVRVPDPNMDLKVTSIVQLFPVDPTLLGVGRVKKAQGRLTAWGWGPEGQRPLGSRTFKFDRHGTLVATQEIPAGHNLDWIDMRWDFLRKYVVPAGTSISVSTAIETVKPDADPDCYDPTTLCLSDDRFQVELDWRDFAGSSGPGIAFPRTDDSGTFFFFDPDNWEMLVKVIDGCNFNDHFWVFAAATTDVEYELTVTDTMSGQSRVYDNPLGNPAPAITDTQAFATCP